MMRGNIYHTYHLSGDISADLGGDAMLKNEVALYIAELKEKHGAVIAEYGGDHDDLESV